LHPHHTYIAGRERPVVGEFTNVYSPERKLPNVDIDVRTIGPERLFQILGGNPILRGKDVFDLYDTYGFPLDLTELMARERGFSVDVAGFEKLMEEQRERARKAQKKSTITVQHVVDFPTQFVGYKMLETIAHLSPLPIPPAFSTILN